MLEMKLWKHQIRGIELGTTRPATMLAWKMGYGKTRTAVEILRRREARRTLILCPLSVIPTWGRELALQGIPYVLLEAGSVATRVKEADLAWRLADAATGQPGSLAVVLNYDAFRGKAMYEWIFSKAWQLCIADESHRTKAHNGGTSRILYRFGMQVPCRLALTGTPMSHTPLDIFAQYRFLAPQVFGANYFAFRARYAVMGGYLKKQIIGLQNVEELQRKFLSIADVVREDEALELPPETDEARVGTLSPAAQKVYNDLDNEMIAGVRDGVVTVSNALSKLLRLQQITSGVVQMDETEGVREIDTTKKELLMEFLEDIGPEEPAVIFCRFRSDLDAVHSAAGPGRSLELSGRRNELAAWQAGGAPVLAVQIQAGGVGVTMVRARYAVFFSLGFSLTDYVQARARLHRPGQNHPVTFIHLIMKGTVDRKIYRALEKRQAVVEAIVNGYKKGGDEDAEGTPAEEWDHGVQGGGDVGSDPGSRGELDSGSESADAGTLDHVGDLPRVSEGDR